MSAHVRLKLDGSDESAFPTQAWIIFALVVMLFVGGRIWHLTDFSLWTDEIFSLKAVRLSWGEMFGLLIWDKVHPPLFFVVLKVWVAIGGESLLWLKLLPFMTAIATIIPFYLLCRELNLSARATNVTLLLIAVNGYLIYYAQEVRMYSFLLFFTVSSFWLFVRFVNHDTNTKKHLFFLLICNLLLIYTHYFGFLVVGVEGLFLLLLDRRKFFLFSISVAVLVLCFGPWGYVVSRAILMKQGPTSGLDWIKRPRLYSLIEYSAILSGPLDFPRSTSIRFLLFGGPVSLWLLHSMRRTKVGGQDHKTVFWWLLVSFFVPLAFVYAFSTLSAKSIWHERYLLIVAIPFMFLVGIALDRLRPEWLRTGVLCLVISWSTLGGIRYINEGDSLTRVPWQNMVNRMVRAEPNDVEGIKVYEFETNIKRPIQFYLDESHERRFQTVIVEDIRAVEGSHFWVAFREGRDVEKRLPPREVLKDKGYRVGEGFMAGSSGQRVYLLPVWR